MTKVLLVEDDTELAINLSELLELDGFNVYLCRNGLEAVEMIGVFNPDIIVSDIRMPGMDGTTLLKTLKKEGDFRRIPFVYISAVADQKDVRDAINLGADDFLSKPFTFRELTDTIHSRLRRFKELDVNNSFQTFAFEHLLTPRELEITKLAATGMSASEIANALFLSTRTVENHKYNILNKLNVADRKSLSQVLLQPYSPKAPSEPKPTTEHELKPQTKEDSKA